MFTLASRDIKPFLILQASDERLNLQYSTLILATFCNWNNISERLSYNELAVCVLKPLFWNSSGFPLE
jgi:hypothetical protein